MIGTILAGAAGVLAAPAIGGLAWRKARQRRVAKALEIDTPNGIAEQRFVRVGGIDQWVQLRGEDRDNPLLLVLHGGPAGPTRSSPCPCGPGSSTSPWCSGTTGGRARPWAPAARPAAGDDLARRVADAIELIEFLRRHLHKDKVVVLAESMGTLTGLPWSSAGPTICPPGR